MDDDEDDNDDWCVLHGDDRHVHVHESAHAVAAVDFGLEVGSLVLHDESTAPKLFSDTVIAVAEMQAVKSPKDFVSSDPVATLRYFYAGVVAEQTVLGDSLPDSDSRDLGVWGEGLGVIGDESAGDLEALSGASLEGDWVAAREWAEANAPRIEALADHIGQHSPPWQMSFADIKRFLADL